MKTLAIAEVFYIGYLLVFFIKNTNSYSIYLLDMFDKENMSKKTKKTKYNIKTACIMIMKYKKYR